MLTVLIFIVILGILIFVHELGHFLAAKKAGVQVDEFGFGYPPRAATIGKIKGTPITLNWIPFGGFVKIVGENYEEEESGPRESSSSESPRVSSADYSSASARLSSEDFPAGQTSFPSESFSGGPAGKHFTAVSKKWQAAILAAGVTFNIIFAWLLFSLGFLIGLPAPAENDYGAAVKNPQLTIIEVVPSSPAELAGLKPGDKIKNPDISPEDLSDFINSSPGTVSLEIERGREVLNFEIEPIMHSSGDRRVIGIGADMIGTLTLPIHKAVYEGGRTTLRITYLTAGAIGSLIKDAFLGQADISQIAGPVGIVGLVGDASRLGFAYLLSFTALISVNLAVINLFPFPALDGGRIVMVGIEGIFKKKINPKFAGILNTAGFALLILLMLFITYRDILKLF